MARHCSICSRRDRRDIDIRLAKGESTRALAKELSLPKSTLQRHMNVCMGMKAPPLEVRREPSRATAIVASLPSREEMGAQYATLGERIDGIVQAAEKAGSLAVAVQGLNSLRQNLDSISKLAGHTGGAPQVNVGVQVTISAGEIAEELAKVLRGADAKIIEAALDES